MKGKNNLMKARDMFRILMAFALVWTLGQNCVCRAAQPLNVLFIGNSHTFYNDMPAIFGDIAASAGAVRPNVGASTIPGYALSEHLQDPLTLNAIDNRYGAAHLPWDFVILQENGGYPMFDNDAALYDFQTSAAALYDRIKVNSPNAVVVIVETAAFNERYFDPSQSPTSMGLYSTPMISRERVWSKNTAYTYIPANSVSTRKNDAIVALIGDAWERNYLDPAAIMLHETDYYHPKFVGSYLGALVLYAAIYNAAPRPISHTGGLDSPTAEYLQRMAVTPVVDDQTPPGPVTSFTATSGNTQIVLRWTNPPDTDFAVTRIVCKPGGPPQNPGDGVVIGEAYGFPGATDSFTHTNLTNGTTYYYAAFSRDLLSFGPPAQASAIPADVTGPSPVSGFSATPGNGQVALSWVNPQDADLAGVKIVCKTTGYPSGVADGDLVYEGIDTHCLHTGLTNGVTYYYGAFAYDEVVNLSDPRLISARPQIVPDWMNEAFDSFSSGDLGGQGAWWTPYRLSGQVESDYVRGGTGKAVSMDMTGQSETVCNQISFAEKTSGYCYLSFDVAQDAVGAVGQEIGTVSFYASDCTTPIGVIHLQKTRLFFEYSAGPGSLATIAGNVVNTNWYNLKVGFNIDTRKMDLWLDGSPKGTNYGWMGPATKLSRVDFLSAGNTNLNPQKLYFDNVRLEPKPGQVAAVTDDGAWSPSASKLHFTFPALAGTTEYQYCIGTTSGGTQTRGWTSCGTSTDVTATGLSLAENSSTYYVSVVCANLYGTQGASTKSNGIKAAPGLARINDAKALPDGTASSVRALRGKVVSAAFSGYVYIQEPSGPFGLKVLSTAAVTPGNVVDVCGVMKGSGAERYLDATGNGVIAADGSSSARPMLLKNSSLGGVRLNSYTPGVAQGFGPNNIGLYAMLCGRVTQRQTTTPAYFYIDDGSHLTDGTTTNGAENTGVRVCGDPSGYTEGAFVAVKGVISCFAGSGLQPQLLASEIHVLRGP